MTERKIIYLTQGREAIVDAVDYPAVSALKWRFQYKHQPHPEELAQDLVDRQRGGYAVTTVRLADGSRRNLYMHRMIAGEPKGLLVDHEDGDGLHNWRSNLRAATRQQNAANIVWQSLAGYKGVSVVPSGSKTLYRARIKKDGQTRSLGHFECKIAAARAYDRAAIETHGPFAWLNFPREDYPELVEVFFVAPEPAMEPVPF